MTITERLELIRAGYTKEEIAAFDIPVQEPQKQTDPEPPKLFNPDNYTRGDPDNSTQADPAKPTQANPEQPKTDNSEVLNAINNLTKAIQLSNMQKIGLDTPGGMTAEEALAEGVFGNKIGGKK